MSGIIEGYNYDIFISYRQKDNKYDGWVTEFVDNLKKELEATFKEEISVYFDINPHDGLLETHDVDASLTEKLKCLIFLPIISRTYCDPKSYAWEHEFKAFVEQASKDQFGLKVKLPTGNVASRILPIRIYDLNVADIKLCETVLGGVLRGVEFVYAEQGVNRPLKPDDDEKINLNNTKYRNQINKVANAVQEIVSGLLTEPTEPGKEKIQHGEPLAEVKIKERKGVHLNITKASKRKLLPGFAILVILIIAAFFAYPKIFKKNTIEKLRSSGERISVAVMPFQNLINDTTKRIWQIWTQDNLINSLAHSEELRIIPIQTINEIVKSKGFNSYKSISRKLDINVLVCGSIKQEESTVFINTQLINANTEEINKAFEIGPFREEMILPSIDSLGKSIKNYLVICKLLNEVPLNYRSLASTSFPDAYVNFLYGVKAWMKRDFTTEANFLSQAVAIDSNFVWATLMLSYSFYSQGIYDKSKEICLKLYRKREQVPMQLKIWINWLHADNFETPVEAIKYLKQLPEAGDQQLVILYNLGRHNNAIYQYDKAILEFEKELVLYKKLRSKPIWVADYTYLGDAYHRTNQLKKEKRLYKKAEIEFPDDPNIIFRQAILHLTENDSVSANRYIKKFIIVSKENSSSEADITKRLADIYSEAGILNKAEEYYRQTLALEPENLQRLNNLAYFLIDKGRNINEGMELVDKALVLSPDNYSYLHSKGWGLYKQSKYQEAKDILQKSWDLRMKNAIYNHEAFLHLEAAKKAVANLK